MWYEIILIFGIVGLSFLFVRAEPLILIKRLFGFKEENYDKFHGIKRFFHRLLYCEYCVSFYLALIFTQDIYMIGIITLLTLIAQKYV